MMKNVSWTLQFMSSHAEVWSEVLVSLIESSGNFLLLKLLSMSWHFFLELIVGYFVQFYFRYFFQSPKF